MIKKFIEKLRYRIGCWGMRVESGDVEASLKNAADLIDVLRKTNARLTEHCETLLDQQLAYKDLLWSVQGEELLRYMYSGGPAMFWTLTSAKFAEMPIEVKTEIVVAAEKLLKMSIEKGGEI